MGARESTNRVPGSKAPASTEAAAPDYYQLLDIDENATADEIKVIDTYQTHLLTSVQPSYI